MAGRYLRGQAHDYGNATLGVAYPYDSPLGPRDSSFATLYLYRRDSDERGLSSDSVLAIEATAFKESLAMMSQRGDYDDYHITAEGRDSVSMKNGWKIPGYRVAYTYRRKSVPAISFFYLYVVDDALLKVRATAAASKERTTDLPDFVHDVVEQTARNAPHH